MLNNFFSIPIWLHKIDIDQSVIDTCYSMKNESSRIISNVGGYQSDIISMDLFPQIKTQLEQILDSISSDISEHFKMMITGCWVNINSKGSYNMSHVHPLSTLSGVLYVSCDDSSGNIKFNSNSLMEHYPINTFGSSLFRDNIEFKPKVGDVLIFPSWIYHSVSKNDSDNDRISIAFNMKQL